MKWLEDENQNIRFFHSYVKGRGRKLNIGDIINEQRITSTGRKKLELK